MTELGPSTRSRQLLNQLAGKELNMDEFLLECAYWALKEGFDELKPKLEPTKPPRVKELELKYEGRTDVDWNKIYQDNPEVKGYYELIHNIEHWNVGTVSWLEDLLKYIPLGDTISRDKVNKKLELFKEKDDPKVTKIKETFNAHTA